MISSCRSNLCGDSDFTSSILISDSTWISIDSRIWEAYIVVLVFDLVRIVSAGMFQIFDFPESLYFGLIQLKFSVLINIHATGVKCKENPSKLLDSFFNATSSTAFLKGMHWVFVLYITVFYCADMFQ